MSKVTSALKRFDEIIILVDNIGMNGEGVARYEEKIIFCEGVLPGEKAVVQITEVRKNYARAELIEILEASIERQTPPCPYYDLCGGCQLQHLEYASQLNWKTQEVREQLKRIGKLDLPVEQIIAAPEQYAYRNKIQLPIGKKDDKITIGLFQRNSHDIVDIPTCLLQSDLGNQILKSVREWIQESGVSIYDEKTHTGLLRNIMIRTNRLDTEALLTFVVNGNHLPLENNQIQTWREQFPELVGIILNHNTKRGNTFLGEYSQAIWGSSELHDQIGDAEFVLTDRSFFQINRQLTEPLYAIIAKHLEKIQPKRLLDAYCGIGSIGIAVARMLNRPELSIVGVEIVEVAVEQAKQNAAINGLEQTAYYVGRCEEIIPRLVKQGLRPDCAVFDPPRQGCQPEFLHALIEAKIPHLIYVSCNPSTLARDLQILTQAGYEVNEVQPVDMFPQTTHVETCVLLSHKNPQTSPPSL